MLRLHRLPIFARVGVTGMLAVFLIGVWASSQHIVLHHQNRDQEPGVSMNDVVGAYHGIAAPSPLRVSLADGHPDTIDAPTREALLAWLDRDPTGISRQYDNLDLGDLAPSEIIAVHCLECHGQGQADELGAGLALHNWDAVKRVAFPIDIQPTPYAILIASTHAHAMTLAAVGLLLVLLLACSRWAGWVSGGLGFLLGVGLLCDVGGWWLTRASPSFAILIVTGGAAFNIGCVLASLFILAELWLPERRTSEV